MVGDWDGLLGLPHCSHWTIGNDIIAIQWYYIMFFLSIAIRYPWYCGWLRNPAPVGRWAKSHEHPIICSVSELPNGYPAGWFGFRNHPRRQVDPRSQARLWPRFPGEQLRLGQVSQWWMDGYWKWIELRDIQNIHLSQHKIWTDTSCYYVIYG